MNGKMMKGILASLAGMLVMACSGCGGGGGGSGASPVITAPVAAITKPVIIDMEGDSLIWGYSYTTPAGFVQSPNNPPAVVQMLLQTALGPTFTTQNNAISGENVQDSLAGTGGYKIPFATRLATNPANIVLADYSLNDSVLLTQDQYRSGLVVWIAAVRAAGKTPVLEEPNPVCSAMYPNAAQYRNILVATAAAQNVLLITQWDYVAALPNWQSTLQPDCIHPTDQLYALKAKREADQLQALVKSLQ